MINNITNIFENYYLYFAFNSHNKLHDYCSQMSLKMKKLRQREGK